MTGAVLTHGKQAARTQILTLQDAMEQALAAGELDPAACPVTHHFAPGAYGREIFIPAGSLVVGKIHKHAHLNVISQGECSVYTEDGIREFKAPHTFVSQPGTKRVVLARTDLVWTTVHVTNETELDKIEDYVIAKSYDELAQLEGTEPMKIRSEA
jgi:hypothetical protein